MTFTMTRDQAAADARLHMDRWGLHDWTFAWSLAPRRFGACHFQRRTIYVSWPLTEINDDAQFTETVLHEIAHALAGPRAKHGPDWRAAAREVGARPERCAPPDAAVTPPKWIGTCPTCGATITRMRLTRTIRGFACAECCRGVYNPRHRFVWTENPEYGR